MKKYFFVAIGVLALGMIYQNCESGGEGIMGKRNSSSSIVLNFDFDYSLQYVPSNQSNIVISGRCNVEGYPDHRIEWEYAFKGVTYQGRSDRPCNPSSDRFMLVIGVGQLVRNESDSFDFSGKLIGINKGVTSSGSNNKIKVTFSASQSTGSTTGSTSGSTAGSTGNTTGTTAGNTGETTGTTTGQVVCPPGNIFCTICPGDWAGGATEYCSASYEYSAYCSNIVFPMDYSALVRQIASERPDLISKCGRNAASNPNWNAFTTEVIRQLRSTGEYDAENWGFNGVRGNINDINGDTISYWGGPGAPQEGQVGGVVMDIVVACGDGGSNTPSWQVLNPYCGCCTKSFAWTLGGKFQ